MKFSFVLLLLATLVLLSSGAKNVWKSPVDGRFSDPTMWSEGRVPDENDDVSIEERGFYNILIDEDFVVKSFTVNETKCECPPEFATPCRIRIIIQDSEFVVLENTLFERFSSIFLIDGTLTTPRVSFPRGRAFGQGLFNVTNMYIESSILAPATYSRLVDPSEEPNITNPIGEMQVTGNLDQRFNQFFMDVLGTEYSEKDTITVNGSFSSYNYSIVIVASPVPLSYETPLQIFYGSNITATFYASLVKDYGDTPDMDNCRSRVQLSPTCPSSGYSIILTLDRSGCCPPGYTGANCDIPDCPGLPDCAGHGVCEYDTTCSCDEGWSGEACNIPDCSAQNVCSGHGTCTPTGGSTACVCDAGWIGVDCSQTICPGVNGSCNGNGYCNTRNNVPTCDCYKGYEGSNCEVKLPLYKCAGDCSGHGTCDTYSWTCECDSGWNGTACHIPMCGGEKSNCNANGDCVMDAEVVGENVCMCENGWSGKDCSTAICMNDCNGRGNCLSLGATPQCNCQAPYIGEDCSQEESDVAKDDSGGLPTNAKAGIAVAVVAVASIAIIVASVLILRKRMERRRKLRAAAAVGNGNNSGGTSHDSNF